MNKQLREKILNELSAELIKTGGEANEKAIALVGAYYNTLSQDISNTIDAVDDISAPFVIAALENYAKGIKELFPECLEVVEWVKQLPSIQVTKKKED